MPRPGPSIGQDIAILHHRDLGDQLAFAPAGIEAPLSILIGVLGWLNEA